jgi:hypothetical protein
MILLNAARSVSVILFARPQSRNKLVISANGSIGVSIFDVALDIFIHLIHFENHSGYKADEFCCPGYLIYNDGARTHQVKKLNENIV